MEYLNIFVDFAIRRILNHRTCLFLGPQGLFGASRRWSDDADPGPFSPFLKDVKKMEEKDDELQTNFGATRCSIWGLALVGAFGHR